MNAFLVAPYAGVTVTGNFTYSGGIKALTLDASGSAALHFDESGNINTISGVQYTARNVIEHYR
jgi:hypothetical protein